MLLNSVLSYFQRIFYNLYEKSYFLKFIDLFIILSIYGVILFSTFAPSDSIGYFAIAAITFSFIKALTRPNSKLDLCLSDKFLLLYFLIVLISLSGSSLFYLSFKGFCKTVVYLGFYVSLVVYLKDNYKHVKYIFLLLSLCLFFESIIAILQNFNCVSEISGWQDMSRLNPEEVMTRVYGSLKPYNPNLFGGYLVAILPSSLIILNKNKVLGFFLVILGVSSIFLTGCRGAYISLFVQIILLSCMVYRILKPNLKKIFISVSTFIFALFASIVAYNPALHARIISIFAMRNDSSNSFRFNVYNSSLNMFKDNWLLGIGIGNQNFREIYGLYMRTGFDALSTYNIYLEIAVESGIFALVAFSAFIISLFEKAIKNLTNIYILSAVISLVGLLIHGCVDTVFFRPQIQFIFWIMVAILRGGYDSRKN